MTTIINGSSPSITFSDGSAQTSATRPFLNRIINGNFVIDQRNAGASVTPSDGQYTLDRWGAFQSASGKYSVQQNAGSVTAPTGFTNYLGVTSLSAYSVGSNDYNLIQQPIEGFNFADCNWGTANAKTVTLSFWVRSSLTGTFGGSLVNSANNRSYPYSYTISAANTWEQKSITVAGDTSGTWIGATNGTGLKINFGLGVGATYSGTAGAWAGSQYFTATGATSVVGTNGATFYITGVQLEVGSTATSFDYRPYGTELALCQRYFQRWDSTANNSGIISIGTGNGTTTVDSSYPFKISMRSTPTLTSSAANTFTLSPGGIAISTVSLVDSTSEVGCLRFGASVTSAGAYKVLANTTTSAFLNFSSEL